MAPIRRYLRITKYSVLECRIYLDNPALEKSWLLNPRDPILPRVIEAVRPFVLPKLREERERSRKKSTKKRGIKDTVAQDDFEVSIFLTETSTRHSLLYKHKHFRDTTQTKLTSNSTRLTGASKDAPIDVDNQAAVAESIEERPSPPVRVLREEDDDDVVVALDDIPSIDGNETSIAAGASPPVMRVSKRRRGRSGTTSGNNSYGTELVEMDAQISDEAEEIDDDDLFVTDGEDRDEEMAPPPAKRRKDGTLAAQAEDNEGRRDDKKKLAMDISYEGFSIYGRVLCLVVKRRDGYISGKGKATATASAITTASASGRGKAGQPTAPGGGQAVMENWITSTQMPAEPAAE